MIEMRRSGKGFMLGLESIASSFVLILLLSYFLHFVYLNYALSNADASAEYNSIYINSISQQLAYSFANSNASLQSYQAIDNGTVISITKMPGNGSIGGICNIASSAEVCRFVVINGSVYIIKV